MHRAAIRVVMGLVTLAAPASVRAEEISYIAGDVWSVTQQLPASEDVEDGAKPQCLFGTRTWSQKGLNFVYALTSHDYIEPWLQVYSENWELPVGKKTTVDLVTVGGTLGFELTAGSVNYLTGSIDPKVIGEKNNFGLNVALGYMLESRRAGISMRVKFAGSEPEWFIPPMGRLETYEVKSALDKCIASLRSKASEMAGSAKARHRRSINRAPRIRRPRQPLPTKTRRRQLLLGCKRGRNGVSKGGRKRDRISVSPKRRSVI